MLQSAGMPSRAQSMPLLSATVRKVKSAVLLLFMRGVQNVSRQPFFVWSASIQPSQLSASWREPFSRNAQTCGV